jgi:hypothetical protein
LYGAVVSGRIGIAFEVTTKAVKYQVFGSNLQTITDVLLFEAVNNNGKKAKSDR